MHRGMPSAKNAAFIRSARPSCVRAISFGRVRHVTRETPTATRRRWSVTAIYRTTTTGDVSRRTAVGGVVTSTRSTPSSPNVDSSSQTCDRPSTVSDKGRNAPYLFFAVIRKQCIVRPNTVGENSSVFSLIRMCCGCRQQGTRAVKLFTNKILQFFTRGAG